MKKPLLIILLMLTVLFAFGTELRTPPSFAFNNSLITKPAVQNLTVKEDISLLQKEDLESIKDGYPLRVAVNMELPVDVNKATREWISMPSGERIWQQAFRSEGAKGLIISFEELYIPEGDVLFIYTEDREELQEINHDTNPFGGAYASDIFYQDEVVLEYVQSTGTSLEARMKIDNVAYVYNISKSIAEDMTCYINVGCAEGYNWKLQKDGVVGLWMNLKDEYGKKGWYICSGSLINNVKQDGTPFILTANHCIEGYHDLTFSTMKFDFFKESTLTSGSGCFTTALTSSLTKTLTGSELLAYTPMSKSSDGTLLRLTVNIPKDWAVYYNGWDARNEASTSGVGIHHPDGMVKKISTYTTPLKTVSNVSMGGGVYTGSKTHWEVSWSATKNGHSVTYNGSSGSPLFNQDGLIVGTLTGGDSFCEDPYGTDIYGKFSYHWDQSSDEKQHFKTYLDPDNTGILVINGYDPLGVEFEQVPVANSATAIGKTGFTANWEALQGATAYVIDVYQMIEDKNVPVNGYDSLVVEDITAYQVTGLEPATEYRYVVRGATRSTVSGISNEITATTLAPSIDYVTPVALNASAIYSDIFTAHWESVEGATSYLLNVYQKRGGSAKTEIVDFTDKVIPSDWTTNSSTYYESGSTGYYNNAAPALRLDASGRYIQSPDYDAPIKKIEYWYRGSNAAANNYLTVSAYDGDIWEEIKKIQPLVNAEGGVNEIISEEELDDKYIAFKITYTKTSGNVAIDDIKVSYGESFNLDYLDGFKALNVGDVLSYKVSDLAKETQYFYSIQASDGNLFSKTSNEIGVKTNTLESGLNENSDNKPKVFVDKEYIHIYWNHVDKEPVFLYNITGNLLYETNFTGTKISLSRKGLSSGIYFVKIGGKSYKVLLN